MGFIEVAPFHVFVRGADFHAWVQMSEQPYQPFGRYIADSEDGKMTAKPPVVIRKAIDPISGGPSRSHRFRRRAGTAFAAALILPLVLSGCVAANSYLDPGIPAVKYEDLVRPAQPLELEVSVESRRNGDHIERSGRVLEDKVERILLASGLIAPTLVSDVGEIHVVLDILEDRDVAASKGVGGGLTFGPTGSGFQYAFDMSVTITVHGKKFTHEALHHSVFTIDDSTAAPKGVKMTTRRAAVDKVIEQMLLAALKEYQKGNPPTAEGRAISAPQVGFSYGFEERIGVGG